MYLPSGLFPRIDNLFGDQGAKSVFSFAERVVQVETDDPGTILDTDTPEDYLSAIHLSKIADKDCPNEKSGAATRHLQ